MARRRSEPMDEPALGIPEEAQGTDGGLGPGSSPGSGGAGGDVLPTASGADVPEPESSLEREPPAGGPPG